MSSENTSQSIAEMFRYIYQLQGFTNDEIDQAIIDNVFAVTMKFESACLLGSRSDPETYIRHFRYWYRSLMSETIGNNLGRKRYLQPVCFAFVDFPGSKGNATGNAYELLMSGLLHVHAVFALRPGEGQVFRRPLLVAGSAHQLRRFGDVKVEAFDPSRGSFENMIDYCKKGADVLGSRGQRDCYDLLPH